MDTVQLSVVDAFTAVPFAGNPAGVCLTGRDDPAWMQAVAAEVNVSETAFVDLGTLAATGEVGLRWFTPTVEVSLCGHATLASAHVLFEAGLDEDPVTGSAHCCLGPYWGERLGRQRLVGLQLSARGGRVGVELRGARVTLRGDAVTVYRGELLAGATGM